MESHVMKSKYGGVEVEYGKVQQRQKYKFSRTDFEYPLPNYFVTRNIDDAETVTEALCLLLYVEYILLVSDKLISHRHLASNNHSKVLSL